MDLCANGHTEIVYEDVNRRGCSITCPVCELVDEMDILDAKITTLEERIYKMEETK